MTLAQENQVSNKIGEKELLSLVRDTQKKLENFGAFELIPKVFNSNIRKTKHFREWYSTPMNYARIIELPLTFNLLKAHKNHHILDISSPKLISLYMMAKGFDNLTISDMEDYFKEDFKVFGKNFSTVPNIEIFDARNIPHEAESFDRVFSISVLEHIPGEGDIEVAKEAARILKPEGIFVITLPACSTYLEEWVNNPSIYWQTEQNKEGLSFYQRRYDKSSIENRFGDLGLQIDDVIYVAENPIKEPQLNDYGMFLHNVHYLNELPLAKIYRKLYEVFRVPLLPYLSYRILSQRYHYLTRNSQDNNIRQVAIKFRKMK